MAQTRRTTAWLGKLGPFIGLVAVWLLFATMTPKNPVTNVNPFTQWENQRLMLLQTAVVGTAAIGATLIIISGGIDLSVGSTIALGTMIVAWLLTHGASPAAALLGGIGMGLVCGLAIGAMVVGHVGRVAAVAVGLLTLYWTWDILPWYGAIPAGAAALAVVLVANEKLLGRVRLSPFIVTLGMWGALRGLSKGIGGNQPIYTDPNWLYDLMRSGRGGFFGMFGLAPAVWVFLALALLMAGVLRYTRFGRHVFAIGSNEQTARLCGVHVERTKLMIYALAIACAGLAGVFQYSYLNMGDPTTAEGYELKVIASVVIGGASLTGGEGSILGTIVGALIMTVVDNGCTKLGLSNWVQEIVTGAIIVVAVAIDQLRQRREV